MTRPSHRLIVDKLDATSPRSTIPFCGSTLRMAPAGEERGTGRGGGAGETKRACNRPSATMFRVWALTTSLP